MNPLIPVAAAAAIAYFLLSKNEDEDQVPPEEDAGPPQQAPWPPSQGTPETPPMPRLPPTAPQANAPSAVLTAAARQLASVAASGAPCDQVAQATFAFQQRAVSEGRKIRTIDGKYGPETRNLLASVLKTPAPPTLWAPGRCSSFKPAPGAGPLPVVGPSVPPRVADTPLATMQKMIDQGDAAGDDYNTAVTAYKAAGMFGVQHVAPAIDTQTGNRSWNVTQALWKTDNAQLQSIPSMTAAQSALHWGVPSFVTTVLDKLGRHTQVTVHRSTIADAMNAQRLAQGMHDKYAQLIAQYSPVSGVGWVGYGLSTPTVATGLTLQEWAAEPTDPGYLMGKMVAMIARGDAAMAASRFTEAIDAYKKAGEHGAYWLAPAIDVQTHDASKPLTHQAFTTYKSTLEKTVPSPMPSVASVAQSAAYTMRGYYQQAMQAGPQDIARTGMWFTGQIFPNGQARNLLQGMLLVIGSGDAALARPGGFDDAVEAFKMAARQGAQWVAPALDLEVPGRALSQKAMGMYNAIQHIPSSAVGQPATSADAMNAQTRAHGMFSMLSDAIGGVGTGGYSHAYSTGIGTVIPSQYKAPAAPSCFDAQQDVQLCAAVTTALATETRVEKLQSFAKTVGDQGYAQAAQALLRKASLLGQVS